MYHHLTGNLIEKTATKIILDVNGVGYEIRIPVSTFSKLPALGEQVKILTHYHVREDLQALFGFYTDEERELFRMLLSVSGIGPKMALSLLSGVALPELKQAIIQGAVHVLTSIPGIGKKTAERVIVELREKVVLEGEGAGASGRGPVNPETVLAEDSMRALVELGYRRQDAKAAVEKALKALEGNKRSVSEVIRLSLKHV